MAYTAKKYVGNADPGTLQANITNTTASTFGVSVADGAGWSSLNTSYFVVAVDYGAAVEEKILCSACTYSGGVATCTIATRGYDNTTPAPHSAGAACSIVATAVDFQEANTAVVNTIGRISAAGDLLVGTATNTLDRVALGGAGKVLASNGTTVTWADNDPNVSYGTTAPSSPVQGQLWFDTNTEELKIYTGIAWRPSYQAVNPYVLVSRTASQALTRNATTTIAYDSVIAQRGTWYVSNANPGDAPSLNTSTGQITINQDGLYDIRGIATLTPNVGTSEQVSFAVTISGTTQYWGDTFYPDVYKNRKVGSSVVLPLTNGTTLSIQAQVTNAGATNPTTVANTTTDRYTYASVAFLGQIS